MERKDKSPEKTKGELNNTEKAEIIQSFLQQISDILKDKKNAKNKNQGDEIIDEFAMDLASIKKSPERLSKNIQSFWEHVKALQTTPLYKKHKALIDNIINLFPELSEIDTSEPDNSESEKETNYYDLLDKLQNAINKNDSEVVENILQSIQTMQIRI
ncbi:hypothetical protein IJM86_07690 [bacterium]|nr:hypothetical protein [bacterium]